MKGVKKAYFDCCLELTDEGIKALAGIEHLAMISGLGVTTEGFKAIAGVQTLNAFVTQINDDGLRAVAGVRAINIIACNDVTNEGVKALAGVEVLYLGDMRRGEPFTDDTFLALEGAYIRHNGQWIHSKNGELIKLDKRPNIQGIEWGIVQGCS